MGTEENLLSRMNTQYHKFSKGQKKLVSYITDNYDKAAFFTAAKLGETVGVSKGIGRAGAEQVKFDSENGSDLWKSSTV